MKKITFPLPGPPTKKITLVSFNGDESMCLSKL